MPINPDQSRMARAAIDIGLIEISRLTGLSPTTISQFEQRVVATPRPATLAILEGLLEEFVIFVDPTDEHGGGVLLKPGVREAAKALRGRKTRRRISRGVVRAAGG